MEILLFLITIVVLLSTIVWIIFSLYTVIIGDLLGAPYVSSSRDAVKQMIAVARLQQGEMVMDLGSGDGKILIEAAKLGCHAVGLEINPFLVWYTRRCAKKLGLQKLVKVYCRNFNKYSLKEADVVFIYLWPKTNKILRNKLESELKNGARVISNAFPIEGWIPAENTLRQPANVG
ncbi:MAG: methyltransferase domain-containing protein, partial [Patescibacteria group bacterium]